MRDLPKMRIHLDTYIKFVRAYGHIDSFEDLKKPIVYSFSRIDGRIIAFSDSGVSINPGSWFIFGAVGVPFFKKDGSFAGTMMRDGSIEKEGGWTMMSSSFQKDAEEAMLFEVQVIPDNLEEGLPEHLA